MQGLLAAQTQKQNKNRQQSPGPSRSGSRSRSRSRSCSHSASPSPSPPRTGNRTAHCSSHHSSSYARTLTHSHHSHNANHHPFNSCPTRRKATGLAERKAEIGRSSYGREKRADRRAPALKRKIPVLWSRESSLHRDRDRLWGSHTAFSLESSRDSSRETPKDETPYWVGEQRFLGRREAVTPDEQCRPMERPSEASQSRGSTWKGLLIITASILSCWSQPTSAWELTIVPEPTYVAAGETQVLNFKGFNGTAVKYVWNYKYVESDTNYNLLYEYNVLTGQQHPSQGRVHVSPNGSLVIPRANEYDVRYYILEVFDNASHVYRGQFGLFLYEKNLKKPDLTVNRKSPVTENTYVYFSCTSHNKNAAKVRWRFQNKILILNKRMGLYQDNETLAINHVKAEDNGGFQCEVWNPAASRLSDPINLTVIYGPEEIKLYPNSVNGSINVTSKENLTLACEATSLPPAQYTWQFNGSSISENSGHNYTIYHASWENAGTYVCLAMNNVTNATISANITVRLIDCHHVNSEVVGSLFSLASTLNNKMLVYPKYRSDWIILKKILAWFQDAKGRNLPTYASSGIPPLLLVQLLAVPPSPLPSPRTLPTHVSSSIPQPCPSPDKHLTSSFPYSSPPPYFLCINTYIQPNDKDSN
uniref:Carcinoembryonic antigen-related cell adhesion molecule 6-like n=1 Tax=Monodelphis domestica TaxID=13616 RepID=A0A5F8H2S4_MONDO